MTELRLKLHQPLASGYLEGAAMATVRLVADPSGAIAKTWWTQEKPVAISGGGGELGEHTVFDLPQGGYYTVDITRPRGADISTQVLVADGQTCTETIAMAVSPHEYLGWQQYAGIVRDDPYTKETNALRSSPAAEEAAWGHLLKVSRRDALDALYEQTAPVPSLVAADVPASSAAWRVASTHKPEWWPPCRKLPEWPWNPDPEFVAWFPPTPDSKKGVKLVKRLRNVASPDDALGRAFPRWVRVKSAGRVDLASVPWAWWGGRREQFDEMRFLYDRVRPSPIDHDQPGRFTITLQDRRWTGILEFLASGRLYRTGEMVNRAFDAENRYELFHPQYALEGKTKGPLVAVAGAIILVCRASSAEPYEWDPWLDNLSNWFRGIPDGPIVLGCRRAEQATTREQLMQAYQMLREGIGRGIPFFSASIGLLSATLARLANDIPAADEDRQYIAEVAARVDPDQPFTVIRLPESRQ